MLSAGGNLLFPVSKCFNSCLAQSRLVIYAKHEPTLLMVPQRKNSSCLCHGLSGFEIGAYITHN